MFETMYYEVVQIAGDYAELKNLQDESAEFKTVALALLPPAISEGCHVKYEMLSYSLCD